MILDLRVSANTKRILKSQLPFSELRQAVGARRLFGNSQYLNSCVTLGAFPVHVFVGVYTYLPS